MHSLPVPACDDTRKRMLRDLRLLTVAATLLLGGTSGCATTYIQNLPLQWRGVDEMPKASPAVSRALGDAPIALAPLQDKRTEPNAVGRYDNESQPFTVRTSDNVATFYGTRMQEMLISAGARFDGGPRSWITIELIELNVAEGGLFNGVAKIRVNVGAQAGAHTWSKDFEGKSKRWGRTHNPENFNECLANAFAEAMGKLLVDPDFANALKATAAVPPG